MKLGIMQPYFMPYIGYWQLMKAVDTYVVYDDVNYIKRGWVNRNNILVQGEKKMFSLSVQGASQNKHFNEIEIGDDFNKFLKTLDACYHKAPYYAETMNLLNNIISYEEKSLAKFLMNSFRVVLDYLSIDTKLRLSSSIDKNNDLRGMDKILHICELLGADTYFNAIGGQNLYDKAVFETHGINLRFVQTEIVPYKQFNNDFVSGLSLIDVLMFNSVEEVNGLLDKYELI